MTMDKFSELKAAAMAATPGPWGSVYDDWSDGDDALISSESRDGMVAIAKIEGGGPDSGYDEPFGTEQQANTAFIAAANPAVVLALLAELEAKSQRITGLERHVKDIEATLIAATDEIADLTIERDEARAKLATPVRLPRRAPENLASVLDGYENWLIATTFRDTWNACLDEVSRASSGFTVEGDEQP
ncbi:hypothetical protein SMQE13_30430 [Serratia marcescens]|nr:hypothetical protein SMQE13_30430 [Serratia marcescens]